MQEIAVYLPSGKILVVPYGTRVSTIIQDEEFTGLQTAPVAALVNNEIVSLSFKVEVNASLEPLLLNSLHGAGIYRRSLAFLLAMAAEELFPDRRLVIGHSLGEGYYYYFEGMEEVSGADIGALNIKMAELVKANLPIQRQVMSYCNALQHIEQTNQNSTKLLLKYRNESKIPVYVCGDHLDISHGPLVERTGILSCYSLLPYSPGFLLRYPQKENPTVIEDFKDNPVLFSVYREYKAWGKILNINCVGNLNELIEKGDAAEFIRTAEALHNKKISEIADRIFERKDSVKTILIAGPSSSGKTTFTKKLSIQLRVHGFNPLTISLDDYFLPRDSTPKDEDGNFDFECLEAIDVPLLNEHLLRLFKGEEITIPLYDFVTGLRKNDGHRLKLEKRNILLIEGIHGLNDRLTHLIPSEQKYKIYVSALTQLNLDDRNRIPTTDNRLLRRIVRDHQFRGHNALTTLGMWQSVRKGENKNIFPFQNNADSAFNSALDYELAVLKGYAEPLLKSVKPYHQEYSEAVRLLSFLNNFLPLPEKYVPDQSILREFIGDSAFKY